MARYTVNFTFVVELNEIPSAVLECLKSNRRTGRAFS